MRYGALSFDLDGTLVDTAGEISEAVNLTLDDFGVPRWQVAELTKLIGNGLHELMRQVLVRVIADEPSRAKAMTPEAVRTRLDQHYASTVGTSAKPYPGCETALARLREAGIRLACVTNKEQLFATQVLEATGLAGYFELLVGGDTLPHKKPHRSVLDHVAKTFAVSSNRMAHVGDSRTDMDAARASNVAAWAVPWGYNAGEPIEATKPERLFQSLPDVADYVLQVNDSGETNRYASRSVP